MKIIHTSDISLGKKFTGLKLAGDKLRAGLKAAFSRIIDYAISEKADMLIIAGNLFDNLEISNNLQNYILNELGRLESIPAIILPGTENGNVDNSFWKTWENQSKYSNIFVLDGPGKLHKTFDQLNCTVYKLSQDAESNKTTKLARQDTDFHIGVAHLPEGEVDTLAARSGMEFDYIALGGKTIFEDISKTELKAAYSGCPEKLAFDQQEAGNIAVVDIDSPNKVKISKVGIGVFNWQAMDIQASEILSNNDLVLRIKEIANENTALRLKVSGLALFETDLAPALVEDSMQDDFLWFEIVDEMKVLPENVSEVKVSEKTLLGQYIKVMAGTLGEANKNSKPRLEKSLKIGYALLQGREIW